MSVLVQVSLMKTRPPSVDTILILRPLASSPGYVSTIALASHHAFFEAKLLSIDELPHRTVIAPRSHEADGTSDVASLADETFRRKCDPHHSSCILAEVKQANLSYCRTKMMDKEFCRKQAKLVRSR